MWTAAVARQLASRLILLFALLFPIAAEARPDSGRGQAVLILSKLPSKGSADYDGLLRIAGAPEVETLDMTKDERWRVPIARVKTLTDALAARGVTVMRVDRRSMRLLQSMPATPGTRAETRAATQTVTMSDSTKTMMGAVMSSPAVMGMTMMMAPPPGMMEHALTQGMTGTRTSRAPAKLSVKVTDKLTLSLTRRGLTKNGDAYVWHGTVDGTRRPVVLLWWPDGRIAGNIPHRGRLYAIRHLGGMMHAVVELAESKLPPEHAAAPPAMLERMSMREDPLVMQGDASMLRPAPAKAAAVDASKEPGSKSAMSEVTLLVAYTKAAAARYSDIGRDLIDVAVAEANQSFVASGIDNVRLKVVHAYETDYDESEGTHFDHVWRLADRGDGVMEEIHELREKHQADIAVLIVHDPHGCGLSTRVAADQEEAFTVVHQECAATMYTLAHEIGHLFGARHDHALDRNTAPFAYGHGFVYRKSWRTIMSYKEACDGCKRLPFWSSPEVKIDGVAAGDEASFNNAKVIREQAERVSRFRGAAAPGDVKQAGAAP